MTRKPDPNSLRQRLYSIWVRNEHISPKECAELLPVSYKEKKRYIWKTLSEFRTYHYFEQVQNAQEHKRVAEWWGIPYDLEKALGHGWFKSDNRNRHLVFHDLSRGTVEWFVNGHVLLRLIGAIPDQQIMAKIMELFCRAFVWFSDDDLNRYLQCPVRETVKHWTFDVGAKLPKFEIKTFEKSHGLRIYSDGSHPTAVEVAEKRPVWANDLFDKFDILDGRLIKMLDGMEKFISVNEKHNEIEDRMIEPLSRIADLNEEEAKEFKKRKPDWYQ
jgi:hypothetical protein